MLDIKLPFRVLQWVDSNRGEQSRSLFLKKVMIYVFNNKESLDVDKIKEL